MLRSAARIVVVAFILLPVVAAAEPITLKLAYFSSDRNHLYRSIGAFASEPESFHTRQPIASVAALRGKRIRTNNETEDTVIQKLGAVPVFVPINETAIAISSGKIDGAMVPPVPTIDFGIGRVAPNHYFLRTSRVPQSLLMNRQKFDSLPSDVQALIRKYSGDWFMENYNRVNETSTAVIMSQLESDPNRKVVFPSPADMETANAIFKSIIDDYAAENDHNAELVNAARAVVAKLHPSD